MKESIYEAFFMHLVDVLDYGDIEEPLYVSDALKMARDDYADIYYLPMKYDPPHGLSTLANSIEYRIQNDVISKNSYIEVEPGDDLPCFVWGCEYNEEPDSITPYDEYIKNVEYMKDHFLAQSKHMSPNELKRDILKNWTIAEMMYFIIDSNHNHDESALRLNLGRAAYRILVRDLETKGVQVNHYPKLTFFEATVNSTTCEKCASQKWGMPKPLPSDNSSWIMS
jgi:hypothetical protein